MCARHCMDPFGWRLGGISVAAPMVMRPARVRTTTLADVQSVARNETCTVCRRELRPGEPLAWGLAHERLHEHCLDGLRASRLRPKERPQRVAPAMRGVLAPMEPGYERLSPVAHGLKLGGLVLLLVAVALLMAPAAYHRMVDAGHASGRVHRFATSTMAVALVPIGLALAGDFYIALEGAAGSATSALAAGGLAATAAGLWYALPLSLRGPGLRRASEGPEREITPLEQRVEQVLTEIRMVLPGVQALLGFGFAATLMDAF